MTILGNQFAMLLQVRCDASFDEVSQVLEPVARDWGLLLEVREGVDSAVQLPDSSGSAWVIAAYGPDRPGLVSALARELADAKVNITDFGSRVTRAGVFAMWFNVIVPADLEADTLVQRLATAGGDVQLEVSMHEANDQDAL